MKNIFLSLLFILLFFSILHAQQQKVDSLELVLKKAKEDTNKVKVLNALALQYIDIGDFKKALLYSNDALSLSIKKDYKKGVATSYTNWKIRSM